MATLPDRAGLVRMTASEGLTAARGYREIGYFPHSRYPYAFADSLYF